jgi:HD-like signal output (HDOD) protein
VAIVSSSDTPVVSVELTGELPPLGNAARQLLTLSDKERQDVRLLALIAQKDPVYLTRLLACVNAEATSAHSADEAIRRMGADRAYALMHASAQAVEYVSHDRTAPMRQYLLMQAVSLSLTVRRLAALLHLGSEDTTAVTLAAFLDVLGIYALLVFEHPGRAALEAGLLEHAAQRKPLPRTEPWLANYLATSMQLAQRWGAPRPVCDILRTVANSLQTPASMPVRILALAQELVAAKLADGTTGAGPFASSLLLEPELADHVGHGRELELAFIGF